MYCFLALDRTFDFTTYMSHVVVVSGVYLTSLLLIYDSYLPRHDLVTFDLTTTYMSHVVMVSGV